MALVVGGACALVVGGACGQGHWQNGKVKLNDLLSVVLS